MSSRSTPTPPQSPISDAARREEGRHDPPPPPTPAGPPPPTAAGTSPDPAARSSGPTPMPLPAGASRSTSLQWWSRCAGSRASSPSQRSPSRPPPSRFIEGEAQFGSYLWWKAMVLVLLIRSGVTFSAKCRKAKGMLNSHLGCKAVHKIIFGLCEKYYLMGLRIVPPWIENPGCFSEIFSVDGAPTDLAFVLCRGQEKISTEHGVNLGNIPRLSASPRGEWFLLSARIILKKSRTFWRLTKSLRRRGFDNPLLPQVPPQLCPVF